MSRRLPLVLLITLAVCLAPVAARAASYVRAETKHFVVRYATEDPRYVESVLEELEAAYALFVSDSGFATFPGPIEVRIPMDVGGLGAEYLEDDGEGNPLPIIEIAPRATMREAAASSATGMTLEDAVRSTAAHELFHVLQDYAALAGRGDVDETAFVEPLATAVQELAAPGADDYVDAAIDLFFAPDGAPFLDRTYDAGIFWVFVMDRYGRIKRIHDILAAAATEDGAEAVAQAFASERLTFLDLWAKFVGAWAAAALPDGDALTRFTETWRRELGLRSLRLPVPIATCVWKGSPLTLDHATETTPAADVLGYADASVGERLRLTHSYGIDILSIRPESPSALAISVRAPAGADYRLAVAGRRGQAHELLSLGEPRAWIDSPHRYDEILLWLTRGEGGAGTYSVELAPRPGRADSCGRTPAHHTIAALEG